MTLLRIIARNRARLADDTRTLAESFSAASIARYRETRARIARYARGRVLDAGCGHMPFRDDVLAHASAYEGLDREPRTARVQHIGDIQDMSELGRSAYDTVLCLEVLEHVADPRAALGAIHRVLRPGGILIVTVPHLSRLHEEPHDYYRYTKYGLERMLTDAGFAIRELLPYAGLFSFLGHQASTILVGSTWHLPLVRRIALWINGVACVRPALWLDEHLDRGGLFALGYIAVAIRSPGEAPQP